MSGASFEIDWSQVKEGSQVFTNGYAWLVETNAAGTVTLYSPKLDKRHTGRPKPWNKATVILPDHPSYIKDWSEQFIDTLAFSEFDGHATYQELLLIVKLGGWMLGERRDGEDWWCPSFSNIPVAHMRLHLLYFHRLDAGKVEDGGVVKLHRQDHGDDGEVDSLCVAHTHGGNA